MTNTLTLNEKVHAEIYNSLTDAMRDYYNLDHVKYVYDKVFEMDNKQFGGVLTEKQKIFFTGGLLRATKHMINGSSQHSYGNTLSPTFVSQKILNKKLIFEKQNEFIDAYVISRKNSTNKLGMYTHDMREYEYKQIMLEATSKCKKYNYDEETAKTITRFAKNGSRNARAGLNFAFVFVIGALDNMNQDVKVSLVDDNRKIIDILHEKLENVLLETFSIMTYLIKDVHEIRKQA